MTNQQILERAIKKAIDGGWVNYEDYKPVDLGADDVGLEYGDSTVVLPHCMIFHHDFAKALWGEEPKKFGEEDWQYHLQQMVIADNPIEYLGENLDV